ncbi:MAG: metallophosphoesterase [Thermogemmatispora sp.]|uniref:metallophosphoesterase n=1 Tax=Thermogemmatispora sp. TaxID=1968838 RepID=UPI00262A9D02|nr:metallophosphoesterase [Thermogemmatispora sp.]MBX5457217.1 metallophosphoesterase [Thermogemmatispora sp.]
MRKHVNTILATAEPSGQLEALERLMRQAQELDIQAVAILGNLAARSLSPRDYGRFFSLLAQSRLPTFYVPGPEDGPLALYLQEAAQIEVIYPYLHGVHGTFALAPGYVVFTGMGGAITDDPQQAREEQESLRYPAWEVVYRLKFLSELKDYEKVFLFHTPPYHKGFHESGSPTLAELIKSYSPRLVLVSGPERKRELLGTSAVVAPGSLASGEYSIIDLQHQTVEGRTL